MVFIMFTDMGETNYFFHGKLSVRVFLALYILTHFSLSLGNIRLELFLGGREGSGDGRDFKGN